MRAARCAGYGECGASRPCTRHAKSFALIEKVNRGAGEVDRLALLVHALVYEKGAVLPGYSLFHVVYRSVPWAEQSDDHYVLLCDLDEGREGKARDVQKGIAHGV